MGLVSKSSRFLTQSLDSLAHLLFPKMCLVCSGELIESEKHLCQKCLTDLPKLYLSEDDKNSTVHQIFWGRLQIENAYAWLIYNNHLSTKTILHHIKYKDRPQLARVMGEKMGAEIESYSWIKEIDALVPVPIHPKKKFIRGYNQSEELAKGLAEKLQLPVDPTFVQRSLHTESQTKKGRFARWDNIEDAFRSTSNNKDYKHIAIVDDVITTGATMERIIRQIQEKNPDLRVSIISLAFAQ